MSGILHCVIVVIFVHPNTHFEFNNTTFTDQRVSAGGSLLYLLLILVFIHFVIIHTYSAQ